MATDERELVTLTEIRWIDGQQMLQIYPVYPEGEPELYCALLWRNHQGEEEVEASIRIPVSKFRELIASMQSLGWLDEE